ncbi:MAG TPA: protein kinase [Planctomycetota bacterium]|nr:protein kinase [Planctomycetota bacterium]
MTQARSSGSERLHASMQESKASVRVGIYELLAELGRGTSATVYLARSPKGDLVALKVLNKEDARSEVARERFSREALMANRIEHRGIVRALDAGEDRGLPYIVMEYVAGVSLRERLAQGPLPAPEAVRILAEVARAMNAAHAAGVIHRDLKPANILLDRAGRPRVSDFGLARDQYANRNLTRTGDMIGTPYYMAPEQINGQTATAAADAWALGVILYECLTGKRPFEGKSIAEVAGAIANEAVRSPSRVSSQPVPQALDIICGAALAKDARQRPSMGSLAADLESIAAGTAPLVPRRRAPTLGQALLVGAGVLLGVAVAALVGGRGKSEATLEAQAELASVAATASSLHDKLDRVVREKTDLEARLAEKSKPGGDPEKRALLASLGEARVAAEKTLPLAIDRVLKDLAAAPDDSALLGVRARLLNHRGRFEETIKLARKTADPNNVELLFRLAEAKAEVGDPAGAREAYLRVVELDPKGAFGLYAKGLTTSIVDLSGLETVASIFERAYEADPTLGDALGEEAKLLSQAAQVNGGPTERALQAGNRAVRADPTSPKAYFGRSFATWDEVYFRSQRKEAVPRDLVEATCADLRIAFALEHRLVYRVYSGKCYVVAGLPAEGMPELDAAVAEAAANDGTSAYGLVWRGNASFLLGDEASATADWVAAFRAGPMEACAECLGYADQVKSESRKRDLDEVGLARLKDLARRRR